MKNKTIARIIAAALSLGAPVLLIYGIGGQFSVLWLALAGFVGLYLMGELDVFRPRFSLKGYGLGWLMAIGALAAGGALNFLMNHSATANPVMSGHQSIAQFVPLILLTVVPSLIGEELFTLSLYKAFGGNWFGVVMSTLAFVAMHGIEYNWNIWQLLALVFIRLVFTKIMLKYGVRTSIALHISYDTLLILPTLL